MISDVDGVKWWLLPTVAGPVSRYMSYKGSVGLESRTKTTFSLTKGGSTR